MSNEIEICNLALTRVGANSIVSFQDTTVEAINCNALYPFARDAVLRDHDWGFARKFLALTLLAETHPAWRYVYAEPPDCMAARRIHHPFTKDPRHAIPFETGLSVSGSQTTVLTNKAFATLIYTSKPRSSSVFDSVFCDALACRLAAELVQPLRGEAQLATEMTNRYSQVLTMAQAATSNETKEKEENGSDFTDARGDYGCRRRCAAGEFSSLDYPYITGLVTG